MTTHKHGCFNRPPFVERRVVQDGHFVDGYELRPRAASIKNFSHGEPCRAQEDKHWQKDAGCIGCSHKREAPK